MRLYRPVGLHELALIWDSGMKEFPPRLQHQPIFYPVTTLEYARQIAKDWNTRDEASAFAGYVTQFEVTDSYMSSFEPRVVGTTFHQEFWISAAELSEFNSSINGLIAVEEAFFGKEFKGWIPERFMIQGKDVVRQFEIMHKTWDCSRMDFTLEVSTNRKTFYLNFLFWKQFDFGGIGLSEEDKDRTIEALKQAWNFYPTNIPLPGRDR